MPNSDSSQSFTVYVADNFHYMDEESVGRGKSYATLAEAESEAKRIVDLCLADSYRSGMTADALYGEYISFGDDPYIVPSGSFSAWDYAKARCAEICADSADAYQENK